MTDERRTNRVLVLMTDSEVESLDTWRFANRYPGRSEAIRALIDVGIGAIADDDRTEASYGVPAQATLPVVRGPQAGDHGHAHAVLPWLSAAIEREQRASFTEAEILAGALKLDPDTVELGQRKAVEIVMGDIGWRKVLDRSGPVGSRAQRTYSAPT